jgi:hypothetical protein
MFTAKLRRMHDLNLPALFEFAGKTCPGRIVAVVDSYVLVEVELNDQTIFLHKHITAIEIITPTVILG